MSIKWNESGKVEFEGAVLSTEWGTRFLCSDYLVGFYAKVWTGAGIDTLMVGTDEGGMSATVTVDATPETLATVEAWTKDRAARRSAEAKAESLLRAWMTVGKGDAVIVFKGRKVAKGTKGVVAWIGNSGFGESVGLAIEGVSGLTFTSIANVKRDHSDAAAAAEMDAAHESAIWFDANVYAAKRALAATGVVKGSKVTPKSGRYAGQACRVIWTGTRNGEARVGVVPATKGRFDADWLSVAAVEAVDAAATWQGLRGRMA